MKVIIRAYVDAALDIERQEGYYGIYIDIKEPVEEGGSLGSAVNSTLCEYRAFLVLTQKLVVLKRKIKFDEVIIFSDMQNLTRQLKKLIPPPKKKSLSKCYREILKNLDRVKWDVSFVPHNRNPAHQIVRKYLEDARIQEQLVGIFDRYEDD
ncbi:MAG: hypothetical protein QW279_01705 [Candidatus Jordarchaeaceae archaeon]